MSDPFFPPVEQSAPLGAFALRVGLGIMLVAHGLLKVFVFTIPGTIGFFESVGFSGWLAYPTILAEVGGGLLLIVGFQTRLISLASLPLLIGALSVHTGNGWVFSNQGGGWEYPLFLVLAAAVQVLIGPGRYALDNLAVKPAIRI